MTIVFLLFRAGLRLRQQSGVAYVHDVCPSSPRALFNLNWKLFFSFHRCGQRASELVRARESVRQEMWDRFKKEDLWLNTNYNMMLLNMFKCWLFHPIVLSEYLTLFYNRIIGKQWIDYHFIRMKRANQKCPLFM